MYKVLLILVLAIATVQGQITTDAPTYGPPTTVPGTQVIQADLFGGVNLKANTTYTVWTLQGFTIVVDVAADVRLSFGIDVKFTGLPKGVEQIKFASLGVQFGFQVKASVDGAIKSIVVQSPPLPSFIGNGIVDGFNNGVLALDKVANVDIFSNLVASYDKATRKVSVALPTSLPVIIFVQVQGKVSAQLNTPYNIIAGANQTIQFDAETAITFRSNLPNAITVKKFNATASGTAAVEALKRAGKALGIFLDITLANKNITHDSIIRLAYTAADLIRAGIQDAKNLKLAYFDEITKNWIYARDTFVNITGQYLECQTPHFSEWAAFDTAAASIDSSTGQGQNPTTDAPTYGPPTTVPGTQVIQADLFGGVNLKANTTYTVWTIQGFTIVVDVAADVRLSFGLDVKFTGLPRGIEQIKFASLGFQVGFQVKASVDGAIKSILVQSPPLPSFIGNGVADGINNGVLALDKVANVDIFSNLVASYDKNTRKVSVALPVSLPVIIFVQVQGKVSAQLNSPYNIIAGANQTIQFDAETAITFRSNLPNAITVKKFNATASGAAAVEALKRAGKALGIFLDITLANKNITHDSVIRLAYTAADLIRAGIKDATTLKLAYFDEITKNWIYARDTFVNITGQYLECQTPHFSEWGAFDSSSTGPSNGATTITFSATAIVMMIMTVLAVRQ